MRRDEKGIGPASPSSVQLGAVLFSWYTLYMRIGIDARLWNETGVGRYIRNLAENLVKIDKKNEYVLFCLTKDKDKILHFVQNDKLRVVIADIRWHTLEEQIKFPQILEKEQLDLVHFPYFSVPFFYNKPFVVTIHDLILHHFPTGQASTLPYLLFASKLFGYKYLIKKAAQKAKKVITVSEATKKEIVDHLHIEPEKIVVTYEGVDTQVLSIKYKVSSIKKPYFLYVGNAYPHKNLDLLLQAFGQLVNSRDGFMVHSKEIEPKLVLVGKEDYFYKRLKERVKKMEIEKNIIFRSEISDGELSTLYQNALALIAPSKMEGFGLPGLEAMANSCLVVASDIPAHKEIYQDAAVYIDTKNPEDLFQKLTEILHFNDVHQYSKFINRGLIRVKDFSWKKMAEQTLKIYNSA